MKGRGNQQRFKYQKTAMLALLLLGYSNIAYPITTLAISQIPLTQAMPTHPQVMLAVGNSESMDGTLSGAIMVGSGSLASSLSSLQSSSSPVNYVVPAGFTPPVQAASGGLAPYTVNQSGTLVDNGPSRLNVAKAGLIAILQTYMQNTDFALMDYSTSGSSLYSTWVYYMSPQTGNFAFTSTPVSSNRYVVNPCYNYTTASSTVNSNCTSMASLFGASTLSGSQWMQIGASSDDPTINDVLYAGSSLPGVFATYNGPHPTTPYPPNYTLANYNSGSVLISYNSSSPNIGGFGTSPTNAGFVPYSPQVMYAMRGFGYGGSQSATTGNILVTLTSAGNPPTTASVTTAINKFLPFLNPETNKLSTTEIKAVAGQSPTAGLLTRAKTYLTSLNVGISCPPKQYVILISDGLPTQDLSGKYWPPLGSAAAQGYGVTATFNANGSLNTTNSQALTDTITAITNLKNAGIKTFIIGLGAGVDPTVNPQAATTLQAMAVAGGTINYYPATSPTDLVNDLNNIMIAVQNGDFTTTAAAVSSTHLQAGDTEYQASYTSSDTPYQDWTGDVLARALDVTTGFPTGPTLWSAQTKLNTLVAGTGWSTSRFIATWNPTLNVTSGGGVPFLWANLNTTQQAQLQPSDTQGSNRLQYLRGNTALEQRNGGPFRNRSYILGDIVYSQPLYVGKPVGPYFSTSYVNFQIAKATRPAILYAGGNDGLLHAFNASTGVEAFAFIPNGVFANLYNLTAPLYNQSHLFFVNGSPQSGDAQFADGSWHTLLVGGEAAGGSTIYALDVTDPGSITNETILASKVLWEFSDTDMGLSYSEPQIAPISINGANLTFAVFFGNGYNSPNNKDILYAVNPQTGQIIRKMDLCAIVPSACNASLPQGLSTVAVANSDGLQGQPITNIYAGDLQGNLWSINVTNPSPAQWTARVLFQARDSSGAVQPITTPPLVTLQPSYPRLQGLFIMFGTGQLLTQGDLSSQQIQSVYGVWDKPVTSTTFTRANLQSQTLSLVSAAVSGLVQNILLTTNNTVNWGTNVGWFNDLVTAGQRVVTQPQLLNGSFIVTLNTPPVSNVCNAPYTSMLLEINYSTGGSFQYPQLDINADGVINSSDTYTNKTAVGIALPSGYASMPTLIGPNANNNYGKLITQSGGQQSTILNPNNSSRKTGWWQLQ